MQNLRLVIRDVDRDVLNDLRAGTKSIETRAATPKYQSISVGDRLTFVCGTSEVTKTVSRVVRYADLDELYRSVAVASVLPRAGSIAEAKRIHLSFPGYKEKLSRYGIMAFWLE